MADTDPNSTDTNKGPTLRSQLEAALETNKKLTAENQEHKQYRLINDAKLGHLSDIQRSALMGTFKSDDKVTAEMLVSRVEELGLPKEPPPPPPKNDANGQQGQQGQQQEQDPNPMNQFVPQGNNAANQDPNANQHQLEVDQSLAALSDIERAQIMAMRGGATGTNVANWEQGLANTKTQAETEAYIRANGPSVGLMHEMDID